MPTERLALDKSTVRTVDQDGHLHVAESNISRACVNPYYGHEIPNGEALGLDRDKVYQLFRDPTELERSAPTFNGKPLLIIHRPQTAADHSREVTVGSVNNVRWEAPYLKAELSVWDGAAIAGITTGDQKELSSAYRYEAIMEPGEYNGAQYDGRMTNIVGNHIALVEDGRAGSDVVVGDAALKPKPTSQEKPAMAKAAPLSRKALFASGSVYAHIKPKLAQDAKINLMPVFAGVTARNFTTKKAAIFDGVKKLTAGKLAQDADIEDVVQLLDQLDDVTEEVAAAVADDPVKPAVVDPEHVVVDDAGGDMTAKIMAYLKGKISDEDMAALSAIMKPVAATDEIPPKVLEKKDEKDMAGKPDMVSKPAMDAAIAKAAKDAEMATITRMRNIQAAERAVRPFIGDIVIAQDSAADVYKLALDHAEVDLTDVPPSAYAAMVKMLPRPGEKLTLRLATDSRPDAGFATRFPNLRAVQAL